MRVPLGGSVTLSGGGKTMTGHALDIGAEGMSLLVPQKLRKGAEVLVEFGLPGSEGLFLIQATVVRREKKPDGFLLGLRFRTEGWVMAHVQEFVRDQLVKLARNRKRESPREEERQEAKPPAPVHRQEWPRKKPEEGEEYKPEKMTIDLDRSERASEVARLFKEALKKQDPKK